MKLGRYTIPGYYIGDCRVLLDRLPEESVHCCITSPPYWKLKDYGVPEQLGQEAHPQEYVAAVVDVVRRIRRVLRPDGTLWMNLGDSYARKRDGRIKARDLIGVPWAVAFALRDEGWYLRSEIIWHKANPNPDGAQNRPTRGHEHLFLLTKSEVYYYNADAVREAAVSLPLARRARSERANPAHVIREGRNRRSVWSLTTEASAFHPAAFPRKLIEPCVLAGCPPGGIILDPFAGSGTVGVVAKANDRAWLLFDLKAKYKRGADVRLSAENEKGGATFAAPPQTPFPVET